MFKKNLLVLGAMAALLLLATGCAPKNTTPATSNQPLETIKIGVIASFSGDAAAYGEQLQKVLEYNLPIINQKAAEKGKKFEFIYEDGKCTGIDAISAYQKLTEIDGVKFIIGGACSSETLALAPLTKQADGKVLTMSSPSSNPAIEGASPYTFSLCATDDVLGKTIAKEMSKFNKVAIITEQNDYNTGIQKVWQEAMKQYSNVQIVADEIFPKGATDFRSLLEKIKNTQPDAIFLNPNVGVTAENLLKQLAEINDWNNYKLYSHYAYLSDNTRKIAPSKSEGMTVIDAPTVASSEFLTIKKNIEDAKGTLNDLGQFVTATTLDVSNILTDLILELGNDPKKARTALTERTFNGYVGEVFFGDHSFPLNIKAAVFVDKNGKLEQQ